MKEAVDGESNSELWGRVDIHVCLSFPVTHMSVHSTGTFLLNCVSYAENEL